MDIKCRFFNENPEKIVFFRKMHDFAEKAVSTNINVSRNQEITKITNFHTKICIFWEVQKLEDSVS